MHEPSFIRWFMVAFFGLFGCWLLVKRSTFGDLGCLFCSIGADESSRRRVALAYARRERAESLPYAVMGATLGTIALVMAVLAATTAASVTILYAAFALTLAAVLAAAYVRMRRSSRRYASLRVRDRGAGTPPYIWALVAATVVMPLAWVSSAPLTSLLVTMSGCAIGVLAGRVATMPVVLSGEDAPVELFVDARLRDVRTANLLATAIAPAFVFEAFTGYRSSWFAIAAFVVASTALVVTNLRTYLAARRPSDDDLSVVFRGAS